jgi:tetratricopeptide (TPR) repeat protein
VVIGARARASFLGVPVSLKRLLAGGVEAAGGATQREADAERPTSTATLLTHLASALLDRGDSKAAVEALRSAIRLNPKLGEAYYEMGRAVRPYPEKKKDSIALFRLSVVLGQVLTKINYAPGRFFSFFF